MSIQWKTAVGYILFLFASHSYAQVFEDFDHGLSPLWQQSPSDHWAAGTFTPISGTCSLHQVFDNPAAGSDRIAYPLLNLKPGLSETIFRFRLRHGYAPSSSNFWVVYVFADSPASSMQPGEQLNGYALAVNMTGSDDLIKFWKVKNGSAGELVNTGLNWQTSIGTEHDAGIEVKRSAAGDWQISVDASGGFDSLKTVGSVHDADFTDATYFGINYTYTATRDTVLWFDDFSVTGSFILDTIAPSIVSFSLAGESELALGFSESLGETALDKTNYSIIPANLHPDTIRMVSGDSLILGFNMPFPDETRIQLAVEGITDRAGNPLQKDTADCFVYRGKPYDVVINEIMADPSPPVGLPEFEYLELFNTTGHTIDLNGWSITVGEETRYFPRTQIPPYGYLLVCQANAVGSFSVYAPAVGLFSGSWLSNEGKCIDLKNVRGQLISSLCYSNSWYDVSYKADGGWSLEQENPNRPCGGTENWRVAEIMPGGSPGSINSVFGNDEDTEGPEVYTLWMEADSILCLRFSEPLDIARLPDTSDFRVSPTELHSEWTCSNYNLVRIGFNQQVSTSQRYQLQLSPNLSDCSGNKLQGRQVFGFTLPAYPDSFGIVINEVLFNPNPGCTDYVELYNRSDSVYDLADLKLATRDGFGKISGTSDLCSEGGWLFFPGNFVVLTNDARALEACYPHLSSNLVLEMSSMPSFNDEEGIVVLLDRAYSLVDEFAYSAYMQLTLLDDPEGVSLERINYDRPTNDQSNWHSAAGTVGYGSPGEKNSQFIPLDETMKDKIALSPELFTPNNDGTDDVLSVSCRFDEPGYAVSISIFDTRGRLILRLIRNELAGLQGQWSWDGRKENGGLADTGIYLVLVEAFNVHGKVLMDKRACVLSNQ